MMPVRRLRGGRFAGQRIEVRMRERDADGRRRFAGVLLKCDESAATVEVDGESVALPLAGMDRAKLVPDL